MKKTLKRSAAVVALIATMTIACASDESDEPAPRAAGAASQQLGIDGYRGENDYGSAVFELLDADQAPVGTYDWQRLQTGELTTIAFMDRDFEFFVDYRGTLTVSVDDEQLTELEFAELHHGDVYDEANSDDLSLAMAVFSATETDLRVGSLHSEDAAEQPYSHTECWSVTVLGTTWKWCYQPIHSDCYGGEWGGFVCLT